MNPKTLGYYGLNLDISTEIAIDGMPLHHLTDLLGDISGDLNLVHYLENDDALAIKEEEKIPTLHDLSDCEKVGLIRALCDRLEVKLMEVAR